MFEKVMAMVSAISGVSRFGFGTNFAKFFVEDVIFEDGWNDVGNPVFDEDAFDEMTDTLEEMGAVVSGSYYSALTYDFGEFFIEFQFSSADV